MKKLTLIVILMMAIGIIPAHASLTDSKVLTEESRQCMADSAGSYQTALNESYNVFYETVKSSNADLSDGIISAWLENETLPDIKDAVAEARKNANISRTTARNEWKESMKAAISISITERAECRGIVSSDENQDV